VIPIASKDHSAFKMLGATHTMTHHHIPENLSLQKNTVKTSGIAERSNTFNEWYQKRTFSVALKQSVIYKFKKSKWSSLFQIKFKPKPLK